MTEGLSLELIVRKPDGTIAAKITGDALAPQQWRSENEKPIEVVRPDGKKIFYLWMITYQPTVTAKLIPQENWPKS